ncbi:hypothetical protein AGLY_013795 [Aphis glycines]|uniref:Uncharacterized protein n=1 Tax=Aphis glycines TaxID=307491 RepID=A0A6G0T542_APHGL|nr:hypothetical protein AGLY_013795 [Aphis glycines]
MDSFNKSGPLVLQGNINEHFRVLHKSNENEQGRQKCINEDTVETILIKFEDYCSPKKNKAMTFYKFFTRNQPQDETFDSFNTSLKELMKQCDFKSDEDWILKSRVVLRIEKKDVQKRLLREDLLLEKTLQYCRAVEAAEQNREELEQSIEANRVWNMEDKTKSKSKYCNNYSEKKIMCQILMIKIKILSIKEVIHKKLRIDKQNLTVLILMYWVFNTLYYIDKNNQKEINQNYYNKTSLNKNIEFRTGEKVWNKMLKVIFSKNGQK